MFKNKRGMFFVGLMVVAITLLACDGGDLIALATNPTATATRTVRPTFTPRPSETPIPADTPPPAATDTPSATATATKKPVVVATAAPKAPTPIPPPPAPSFAVNLLESYTCEQGADVYDVLGRIRSASNRKMLGGYIWALLTPDGRILPNQTFETVPDEYQFNGLYSNCKVDKWWNHNMKLDASEYRGKGPFIVRVIRSKTDPTPLSKDVQVDFKVPIRWIIEYNVP